MVEPISSQTDPSSSLQAGPSSSLQAGLSSASKASPRKGSWLMVGVATYKKLLRGNILGIGVVDPKSQTTFNGITNI